MAELVSLDGGGAKFPLGDVSTIGRDPASLRVSAHVWTEHMTGAGQRRVDQLAAFAETGISRIMTILRESARSDETLESFAADVRSAGLELAA